MVYKNMLNHISMCELASNRGRRVRKDDRMLKKKLTAEAHMSASGGREKQHVYFGPYGRYVCVQWSNSGPGHPKDVENDMD